MDAGELREAVNQAGAEIDVHWRVKAVDHLLRWDRGADREYGPADVQRALDLARDFRGQPEREVPTGIRGTAYSNGVAERWVERLRPWMEDFRRYAFESTEAPFTADEWPEAVRWIEAEIEALAPPEPPAWLESKPQGRTCRLRYLSADRTEVRRVTLSGFHGELWSGSRHMIPPVVYLECITHDLETLTGFRQRELVALFLADFEPDLERAVIRIERHFYQIPDGTEVESNRVVVELRTPDLAWEQLQQLHSDVRDAWERCGVDLSPTGSPTGKRWTELDARLVRVVESLEGEPEGAPAEWWERVNEAWVEGGGESRSVAAHRKHWSRVEEKRELGLDPSTSSENRFP